MRWSRTWTSLPIPATEEKPSRSLSRRRGSSGCSRASRERTITWVSSGRAHHAPARARLPRRLLTEVPHRRPAQTQHLPSIAMPFQCLRFRPFPFLLAALPRPDAFASHQPGIPLPNGELPPASRFSFATGNPSAPKSPPRPPAPPAGPRPEPGPPLAPVQGPPSADTTSQPVSQPVSQPQLAPPAPAPPAPAPPVATSQPVSQPAPLAPVPRVALPEAAQAPASDATSIASGHAGAHAPLRTGGPVSGPSSTHAAPALSVVPAVSCRWLRCWRETSTGGVFVRVGARLPWPLSGH